MNAGSVPIETGRTVEMLNKRTIQNQQLVSASRIRWPVVKDPNRTDTAPRIANDRVAGAHLGGLCISAAVFWRYAKWQIVSDSNTEIASKS
jgi:hypothetical protein